MNKYSYSDSAFGQGGDLGSSSPPVEFDSTSNRHVAGNLRGFYFSVPREKIPTNSETMPLRKTGNTGFASGRRRREI